MHLLSKTPSTCVPFCVKTVFNEILLICMRIGTTSRATRTKDCGYYRPLSFIDNPQLFTLHVVQGFVFFLLIFLLGFLLFNLRQLSTSSVRAIFMMYSWIFDVSYWILESMWEAMSHRLSCSQSRQC